MKKTEKQIRWITILLLTGLTFLLFFRTLFVGFFSDDYHFLHVAASGQSLLTYPFTNIVGEDHGGSYGPVLSFLWRIQYVFFGMHAFWYHFVVLLVFSATAYLITRIVSSTTKDSLAGMVAGIIFVLLPVHVGSLAWIAVAPHLWATFFFLGSVYSYIRFREETKKRWYGLSLILVALSVFTKETAILYPVVFFLIEVFFLSKERIPVSKKCFNLITRLIPYGLIGIVYLTARYQIAGYIFGYYGGNVDRTVLDKLRMFTELSLNMFFPSPYRQSLADFLSLHKVFFTLSSILLFSLYLGYAKWRSLRLGFFLSYIALSIPFLSLLYHPHTDSGDRYAYLLSTVAAGMLGIFIVQTWRRVGKSIQMVLVVGGIIVTLFCVLQIHRVTQYWQSAAEVREVVLRDIEAIQLTPQDFVFFIGLPDNLSGAELFRNAVREAVDLETPAEFIQGVRIPIYTQLSMSRFQKQLYSASSGPGTTHFEFQPVDPDDIWVFTGFPLWVDEYSTSTLHNYLIDDSTGNKITFELNKAALDTLRRHYNRVLILYFDGTAVRYKIL